MNTKFNHIKTSLFFRVIFVIINLHLLIMIFWIFNNWVYWPNQLLFFWILLMNFLFFYNLFINKLFAIIFYIIFLLFNFYLLYYSFVFFNEQNYFLNWDMFFYIKILFIIITLLSIYDLYIFYKKIKRVKK